MICGVFRVLPLAWGGISGSAHHNDPATPMRLRPVSGGDRAARLRRPRRLVRAGVTTLSRLGRTIAEGRQRGAAARQFWVARTRTAVPGQRASRAGPPRTGGRRHGFAQNGCCSSPGPRAIASASVRRTTSAHRRPASRWSKAHAGAVRWRELWSIPARRTISTAPILRRMRSAPLPIPLCRKRGTSVPTRRRERTLQSRVAEWLAR